MVTLLVDGNNMLAMNAHAHSSLTSPEGEPTGAIYGTLLRLRSLMLQEIENRTERIVFVFDAGRPRFRTRLCPEYKSNRKKSDDDPFVIAYRTQSAAIKGVLRNLGVSVAKAEGFEADDLIAGLATKYPRAVVVSSDRDLLQLAGKNVAVYRPSSHSLVSKVEKGYLLARCIQGDTSDAIPGVPGLGEKRSWEVVRNHGDAAVFSRPSELLEAYQGKYAEKIREHAKTIKRNWKIMRLRKTGQRALRVMEYTPGAFDAEKTRRYLAKTGMRSILREGDLFTRMFKELKP